MRLYVTVDEPGRGLRPWLVGVTREPATADELRTVRFRVRMACGDALAGLVAFSPLAGGAGDGDGDGDDAPADFLVLSVQPFD